MLIVRQVGLRIASGNPFRYNARINFRRSPMPAEVGDKAPDFTLRSQTGEDITLSQYIGQKNVVLQTHVMSFTGG